MLLLSILLYTITPLNLDFNPTESNFLFPSNSIHEYVVETDTQENPELEKLLTQAFEKLGIEVDKLSAVESIATEECKITIKGKLGEKDIDLTITFNVSCGDLLKELMK